VELLASQVQIAELHTCNVNSPLYSLDSFLVKVVQTKAVNVSSHVQTSSINSMGYPSDIASSTAVNHFLKFVVHINIAS
jgi:hypothetical protein